KMTPRNFAAVEFSRALRELGFQPLRELRLLRELLKAAPVFFAGQRLGWMIENAFHRWQAKQLISGGCTFQLCLSVLPISNCVSFTSPEKSFCSSPGGLPYFAVNVCAFSSDGFQSRFVTCSRGRRLFSGARWQSRHHDMLCGFAW